MDYRELREVMKFLHCKGLMAKDIYADMLDTLGDSAPSYAMVKKWVTEFRKGRISEDLVRSGRPRDVSTYENVDFIRNLIKDDERVTVQDIAKYVGISFGSVHAILSKLLELVKVSGKWVPRRVSNERKMTRLEFCKEILAWYRVNPSRLVQQTVVDDAWIYHFERTEIMFQPAGQADPENGDEPSESSILNKALTGETTKADGKCPNDNGVESTTNDVSAPKEPVVPKAENTSIIQDDKIGSTESDTEAKVEPKDESTEVDSTEKPNSVGLTEVKNDETSNVEVESSDRTAEVSTSGSGGVDLSVNKTDVSPSQVKNGSSVSKNEVNDEVDGSTNEVNDGVDGSLNKVKNDVDGSPNKVKNEGDGSPNKVKNKVDGSPNKVKNEVDGSPNKVKNGVDGSSNKVKNEVDGSQNQVENDVDSSPNKAKEDVDVKVTNGNPASSSVPNILAILGQRPANGAQGVPGIIPIMGPHGLTLGQLTGAGLAGINVAQLASLAGMNPLNFAQLASTGMAQMAGVNLAHMSSSTVSPNSGQKRPNSEPNLLPKKKQRSGRPPSETSCIFWDSEGVIHVENLESGQKLTGELYCDMLKRLKDSMDKKRPGALERGVLLLEDQAPAGAKPPRGLQLLPVPVNSPDLSPSDFHIFPKVKEHLRFSRPSSGLTSAIESYIKAQDDGYFKSALSEMERRCTLCVDLNGDYVEK